LEDLYAGVWPFTAIIGSDNNLRCFSVFKHLVAGQNDGRMRIQMIGGDMS